MSGTNITERGCSRASVARKRTSRALSSERVSGTSANSMARPDSSTLQVGESGWGAGDRRRDSSNTRWVSALRAAAATRSRPWPSSERTSSMQ